MATPRSGRAVMEEKARLTPEQAALEEALDPERALHRQLNFYPTPPWATRAFCAWQFGTLQRGLSVWDPCAGEGHMAEVLREFFETVHASDIHEYTGGPARPVYPLFDFLDLRAEGEQITDAPPDWIIFNPPFDRAQQFIERALRIAQRGVACFARLALLESDERYTLLSRHLAAVHPFSERVPIQLGSWDPSLRSATAYAWFVFRRQHVGQTVLQIIPPGQREKFWRADDVQRFAKQAPAPLFDAEGA